jgi:hypothetical protein
MRQSDMGRVVGDTLIIRQAAAKRIVRSDDSLPPSRT